MLPAFTCALPATLRRRTDTGQLDARGRRGVELAAPESIAVWAWYVGMTAADQDGHAARVQFDATAYPPTSLGIRVRDHVELPGEGWFEVISIVDYDHNSIDWKPGVADMKLRRVTG